MDSAMMMALFIMIVGLLTMFFMLLVNNYATDLYKIPSGTEEIIFQQRLLNNCFIGEGALISWDNFNQNNLDTCYNLAATANYYDFRLSLEVDGEEKTIQTRNWENKPDHGESIEVPVWKLGEIKSGTLSIEVENFG